MLKTSIIIMKYFSFIFVMFFGFCTNIMAQTTEKKGWKLVWEDEFDRDDIFSTGIWSKIPRGNNDWNNTMSANDALFDIKNGNLILSGRKNDLDPNDSSPYITAGVYTKDKQFFNYGKIEIRCKLEAGQGAWPAIWLLPKKGSWPDGGEIDIMERLNFDNFVYQTVHTKYTKANLKTHKHFETFSINPTEYNTYAVEITRNALLFYVNDTLTFSYPRIKKEKKQFPFGKPFYLLIDMQLGGEWVGEVQNLNKPIHMYIDWVRYYKK